MNTPETMPFPCEKCGVCCKYVYQVEDAKFLDRGDGTCKYLNEDTKECIIYDFRPDICRADKYYYKKFKDKMTWEEYVEYSKKCCQALKDIEKKKK